MIADVLGALPKSALPGAKKALAEIWNAEDKEHARAAKKFAAAHRQNGGGGPHSPAAPLAARKASNASPGLSYHAPGSRALLMP